MFFKYFLGTDRNEDTDQNDDSIKEEVIDNPYLRPAKIPTQKISPVSKLPDF